MDPSPPRPSRRISWSDVTFVVLALVLVAAIGTGLAWSFLSDRDGGSVGPPSVRDTGLPGTGGSTGSSGPSGEGSCGRVQVAPPFGSDPGDRAHAEVPLSRYPTVPPASGPHASITQPPGSYAQPPPVGQVLHSMEHGAVVIWFEPSLASNEVLAEIRGFVGPSGPGQGLHVIIAPYDYPDEGEAGRLPSNVAVAFAAWHRLQSCTRLDAASLRLAADFLGKYRCPPGCDMSAYLGEAPEAGAPI